MTPTQPTSRSRAEWAAMLDRIRTELARTLEQTPEVAASAPAAEPSLPVGVTPVALERRLDEIQASLKRAERNAAEIDEQLHSDAETVRRSTGFVIGGVAPVGHLRPIRTFVDVTLARYDTVWAAAGHPHAVFPTSYDELLRVTGGQPIEAT